MRRFQKFRNTIYFDKYKIMMLDNGRFAITDLDFNIIDDLKGQGYKTRRRAANAIQYTHVEKKFKPMKKEKINESKDFKDLRNEPEFQTKYELGLKRMCLVSCVIAILLAIPIFFLINQPFWTIYVYMILVIVGIRLSPFIVDKIWK